MPPVHLRLLARRGLEADKRPLLALAPPRCQDCPHLCDAAGVATLLNIHKETGRVHNTALPALAQIRTKRINLPLLRLPFILAWCLPKVLPNRLPVQVQLASDLAHAHAVMMQLLYLHKTLQSQHPNPPRIRMLGFGLNWGFFKR
jgi:hypothetical protein